MTGVSRPAHGGRCVSDECGDARSGELVGSDTARCLDAALLLTVGERDMARRLAESLPPFIVDAHVHVSPRCAFGGFSAAVARHVGSTFGWFERDALARTISVLHPCVQVQAVIFPHPYPGIDQRVGNDYVLDVARGGSALTGLYGDLSDSAYTLTRVRSGLYSGVKLYPVSFLAHQAHKTWVPDWLADACASAMLPIVLHLPTPLPACIEHVVALWKSTPDLKLVLAHMGLQYSVQHATRQCYQALTRLDGVYLDTAMVTDEELFRIALETLGPTRVLYGSDLPISLVRGRYVRHPERGVRLATPFDYHWVDPREQKEYAMRMGTPPHLLLQSIKAIQTALSALPDDSPAKTAVFGGNARVLFSRPSASQ